MKVKQNTLHCRTHDLPAEQSRRNQSPEKGMQLIDIAVSEVWI